MWDNGRAGFLFQTLYKVRQVKLCALREECIRDVAIYQDIGLLQVTTADGKSNGGWRRTFQWVVLAIAEEVPVKGVPVK